MSDEIKVTLTLRKHVAERLKRMCYARNITASHLVDSWVFESDDNGRRKPIQEREPTLSDIFDNAKRMARER